MALSRHSIGEGEQEGAGMNVRQPRLADAIASLESASTLIVPGYEVSVDAAAFAQFISVCLRELHERGGRRVDTQSLAQYIGMDVGLLRRFVGITPNAVAE